MTRSVADFENYFLLVLSLFLDEGLKGRAGNQERIYDSGAVARFGLNAEGIRYRFTEVYERAFEVLPKFGFDPSPLRKLSSKSESNTTPSDEMLEIFKKTNSINEVMKDFSFLILKKGKRTQCRVFLLSD